MHPLMSELSQTLLPPFQMPSYNQTNTNESDDYGPGMPYTRNKI